MDQADDRGLSRRTLDVPVPARTGVGKPSETFQAIQALLQGRDHTFFAGHLHYYDYDEIDGHEHITMGPAGASFHQDGPGNVDHIMWVTMTEDGPQIGNIALKGIFDRKGLDPSLFGAYDRKGAE